jgi:tetratricopeptide (TPR) repeat protein
MSVREWGCEMDTVKELFRTKSFWVFVGVAILGGVEAIYAIPLLGLGIAAITIFGISLQGVETVLTEKKIDQTRKDAATQHSVAMQEIIQARGEAATQHTEALQEIEQARVEAAKQNAEAMQEIQKARDEARAENILLEANKFATSLLDKDAQVNKAVALNPDIKQRELRQMGIEMSIAVIDGYDPVTQRGRMVAGLGRGMVGYWKLERKDIAGLVTTALNYLQENVLETIMPDADGLLYLACMYGYQEQFEDMIRVIGQAVNIDENIKEQFQQRKILQILLRACNSDQIKLEALRKSLSLPPVSKKTFCEYLQNFDLTDFDGFIEWMAVKRPGAPGKKGTFLIKITPPYPSNEGQVSASGQSITSWDFETVIPTTEPATIEELYKSLHSLFILFCPIA